MKTDPKVMVNAADREVQQATPFFARFLENQKDPEVRTDVKAGAWPPLEQTMKAPSDSDEW